MQPTTDNALLGMNTPHPTWSELAGSFPIAHTHQRVFTPQDEHYLIRHLAVGHGLCLREDFTSPTITMERHRALHGGITEILPFTPHQDSSL